MSAIAKHPYEACDHPGRHGYGSDWTFCETCRQPEGATCHQVTEQYERCGWCRKMRPSAITTTISLSGRLVALCDICRERMDDR